MPATFAWQEYRTAVSLEAWGDDPRERRPADYQRPSAGRQRDRRDVVDEDFRVRGFANLFLCDASVFPTSLHVNPQLTVIGMAQYAAGRILGGDLAHGQSQPRSASMPEAY